MMVLRLLGLLLALAASAGAAEIDSVTFRQAVLDNAAPAMNARVNGFLETAVERANARGRGCNPELLYFEVRRAIAAPFVGHHLAEALDEADDLDRRHIALRDSVYRDLGLLDAISVHLKDLSAVVQIDDHRVGVDKFGHFFVQGWAYFERAYLDEKGLEAALEWGEQTERSYYGLYTTGIYSYADLAANFEGMRFWLRVLGHDRDPLERGWYFNRPYIRCARRFWSRERYWRVKRKVRIEKYVTAAWDEGNNCCRFRSPDLAARVTMRVAERGALEGAAYACPIDPEACARTRDRFGPHAARLLHPRCLEDRSEINSRAGFW